MNTHTPHLSCASSQRMFVPNARGSTTIRLRGFASLEQRAARSWLHYSRGFTLLEVMVVVAIITILVIIALPSYDAQIRRGKRASAESHLTDVAARQQQYLFDNRAYAADLATLNMTTPTDVSASYTISVVAAAGPPPSFTITATPTGKQVNDLGGAALTISNSGAKTPAGAW